MGRPPKEINYKRCENLKELLDEVKKKDREKNTQANIAERIYISQQELSKIVNKHANLTEETAKRIIEEFPEYRLNWLLGYDTFKTYPDELAHYTNQIVDGWKQQDNLYAALMFIIHSMGYDVAFDSNCFCIIDNENEDYAILSLSEAKYYYDELFQMINSMIRFHFDRHKKERIQ